MKWNERTEKERVRVRVRVRVMQYLVSNAHEIHVDSILHKACHHVLSIVANSEEEGINLCWPSFGQSLMSWVCPSVFKIKSEREEGDEEGEEEEEGVYLKSGYQCIS